MVVRISLMVLRICVLLAFILGILFWIGVVSPTGTPVAVHMLLGLLVVLSLAIIGIALLFTGSRGIAMAIFAILWAALVLYVGVNQDSGIPSLFPGVPQTVIKVVHLLLGLLSGAVGEMAARRYKSIRKSKA